MSGLRRTYKKIKDANAGKTTGNEYNSWVFYHTMDSLFSDKAWVSPPAIASSDGPAMPSTSSSACHTASDSSECLKEAFPKKKRVKE